ncbi:hypothetical protein [Amycolatopsis thermophila]|uniref:Secreted protein n=1 Tax=Amycolatopsis thermophila TaxID=206084 RepID=A0ABU0F176_9PSEU|nr:hypothetical protein [Amycolatopsis thermophila]MDQ0380860.1 hypothetical protein [Amycolatopsis thermophila]
MRIVPVVALGLVTLAGCGPSGGAAGDHACTLIGAMPGVRVDIAPRPGQDVAGAAVTLCRGGECRTWHPELRPATAADPQGCTGTAPDDACSARVRHTGGWFGFIDVADLREGPYDITVVLTDARGTELGRTTQNTAARLVHPNGPECGGGVPQVQLGI